MPTYDPAPATVRNLIAERIASGHYPDLETAEVTFSAWFAWPKKDEPAVKSNGQAADSVTAINGPKGRREGMKDVSIYIDGTTWNRRMTDEEKVAEIDERLQDLAVCRSKATKKNPVPVILSDDNGRPKLKKVVPIIYTAGHARTTKRHGAASPTARMAREMKGAFGQILFAWGDDMAPGDDIPEIRLSGKTVEDDDEDEDAA